MIIIDICDRKGRMKSKFMVKK